MKKIKLILAVMAVLFTSVSCLEKEVLKDSHLYGKWVVTEVSYYEYENDKLSFSETTYASTNFNWYFQFTNDGKGQFVQIEEGVPYITEIKSWVLLDDSLVIRYENDESETYKISYLNRSDLQMSESEAYTEDGIHYQEVYSLTLRKL